MQRCQGHQLLKSLESFRVEQGGTGEALATMNHSVGHQKQVDLKSLQRCGQPRCKHLFQSADRTTVLTD